jgi:phage repressor protein C with HTH and peptisase S24 domain
MSLGSRIKEARQKRGLKQVEVAARFRINAAAVSQWETGETRPDTSRLRDLADLLGVSVDWLTTDDGPEGDPRAPAAGGPDALSGNVHVYAEPPAIGSWRRDLPVYGTAVGGQEKNSDFDFNTGDIIDYIRRPPRLHGVKAAFAVYLVGASLEPRFREGAPVLVHPGLQARPGDDVLVELKPTGDGAPHPGLVKRLVSRTETRLRLQQFNPPDDNIIVPMKRVLRLYRVIPYEDLFGF